MYAHTFPLFSLPRIVMVTIFGWIISRRLYYDCKYHLLLSGIVFLPVQLFIFLQLLITLVFPLISFISRAKFSHTVACPDSVSCSKPYQMRNSFLSALPLPPRAHYPPNVDGFCLGLLCNYFSLLAGRMHLGLDSWRQPRDLTADFLLSPLLFSPTPYCSHLLLSLSLSLAHLWFHFPRWWTSFPPGDWEEQGR